MVVVHHLGMRMGHIIIAVVIYEIAGVASETLRKQLFECGSGIRFFPGIYLASSIGQILLSICRIMSLNYSQVYWSLSCLLALPSLAGRFILLNSRLPLLISMLFLDQLS